MYVLGLFSTPTLEYSARVVVLLMQMYTQMGDKIAMQYGGSEAQKKMKQGSDNSSSKPQGSALITSIKRYYR